ncbi:hypothetical protein DSO57_1005832 [Entomophthora muscae]|uniref:Uncharacterized protein n=1 Tax=Entomophthora muscae TaxID=34485 RepID=A0ACC2UHF6_9FUNG|nr:hypothetical protein DSO57_1005832 [Entomophthora muscae]
MFGFLSIFKYNKKENYEAVLAELDDKIKEVELSLADLKLQRGYYSGTTFIYLSLIYAIYVPFYFFFLRNPRIDDWYKASIKGAPVVAVPILLYFIRSVLDYFFARRVSTKEELLKALRTKQKIKVEELKKNSSYYQTKSLIDRYSEKPKMEPKPNSASLNGKRMTPALQAVKDAPNSHPGFGKGPAKTVRSSNVTSQEASLSAGGERFWYDKLVDAIVGEEATTVPQFALICQHCFSHNGLVSPIEYETIQYKCPSCKKFNPSKRSLRRKSIDLQNMPNEQKPLAQSSMMRSATQLPFPRQQSDPDFTPKILSASNSKQKENPPTLGFRTISRRE